jgi:hypothetical protein
MVPTDIIHLHWLHNHSQIKNNQELKISAIQLDALHGDADLFVSKSNRHPNKADFDKSSVKSNENSDLVFFEDPNG